MYKLFFIMILFVSIGIAQVPFMNIQSLTKSANDSLVDLFPLAIGNQWTYGYYWSVYTGSPIGEGSYTDTGTVTMQVINKVVMTDSTQWFIQETYQLWVQIITGAYNGPTTSVDTIKLIELHQGQHRMYINGNNNNIIQSVFPFLYDVDTMVYRYNAVNPAGIRKFTSRNKEGKGVFKLNFKQGTGLSSVFTFDGCTCEDGYNGIDSLRTQIITDVSNSHEVLFTQNFQLSQNYPNPFNPSTTISFHVPFRSFVTLKIFDCLGREIVKLASEEFSSGNYSREWNAINLPNGVYFYRLQAGSFSETKKLVLLK